MLIRQFESIEKTKIDVVNRFEWFKWGGEIANGLQLNKQFVFECPVQSAQLKITNNKK